MSIQNTKKKTIYLVGTTSLNFNNLTIEAIKTINKSECVILSDKTPKKFISQLKRINTRLCLVRQLSTSKKESIDSAYKIALSYSIISILAIDDPIFIGEEIEKYKFFVKKGFQVKIVSGIINLLDFLNLKLEPITDRKKNSAVSFIESKKVIVDNQIKNLDQVQKLIIKLNHEKGNKVLVKILTNLNQFSKFNFVNTLTYQKISLKKESDLLSKIIEKRNFNYLILEKI
tara:strand:+ start:93 stop:782 length:690 start_codon:yes stop_codon:yes gene_type:complete